MNIQDIVNNSLYLQYFVYDSPNVTILLLLIKA